MVNTTVGLEALQIPNIKIYIPRNIAHDQLQLLVDYGVADCFASANELYALLEEDPKLSNTDLCNYLWTSNASENYQKFFLEMMCQQWPEPDRFICSTSFKGRIKGFDSTNTH